MYHSEYTEMNFDFPSYYQPADYYPTFPYESHFIPAADHFLTDFQQASPPIIDPFISPAHAYPDSFFQYPTVTTSQWSDLISPPSQQRSDSYSPPSYSPAYTDTPEGDQKLQEDILGILNSPFPYDDGIFYDNPEAPAYTNSSSFTSTTSYSDESLSPTLVKPFSEIRVELEGRTDRENMSVKPIFSGEII